MLELTLESLATRLADLENKVAGLPAGRAAFPSPLWGKPSWAIF